MIEKCAIILLANVLFFAKTLTYKYVSDDIPAFNNPVKFRNKFEKLFLQLKGTLKKDCQMEHLITIGFHAVVCMFIYLGFGANNISFLAAILFSFNPINNQCSVWMCGRGYVISALGMLMALTFPKIGLIFLLMATWSNAGFLAPLCLVGSPYPWLLAFAPLCWLFWYKNFKTNVAAKIKKEMYTEDKRVTWKKLILMVKTFGFYISHSLIPFKTTFYHSYMQSMAGSGVKKAYSYKDRFLYIGIAFVAAIGFYWAYVPWNMISFGLLWWCVCIAPFCNLVRMQQEIGERYTYLPNVGLMFVLASVLISYPYVAVGFLAMYATKMWFYMDCYTDDYYLCEYASLHSPDSWFAWHVRAMKRWDNKSYQEAVILWTMAKLISPNEFKVLINIATALKLSKHDKEALHFFEQAEKNVPPGQEDQSKDIMDNWRKGELSILL